MVDDTPEESQNFKIMIQFGGILKEVTLKSTNFSELEGLIEDLFHISPGSYSCRDMCGKVDGHNWARALQASKLGSGDFLLKIEQSAEWRKLSELEARLDKLAEKSTAEILGTASIEDVLNVLEKRMSAGVGELLQSLRCDLDNLTESFVQMENQVSDLCHRSTTLEAMLPVLEAVTASDMALRKQLKGLEETVQAIKQEKLSIDISTNQEAHSIPAYLLDLASPNNICNNNNSSNNNNSNNSNNNNNNNSINNAVGNSMSAVGSPTSTANFECYEGKVDIKDHACLSPSSCTKLFFKKSAGWLEGRQNYQYPLPDLSPQAKARLMLHTSDSIGRLQSFAPFQKVGVGKSLERSKTRSMPHLPPV